MDQKKIEKTAEQVVDGLWAKGLGRFSMIVLSPMLVIWNLHLQKDFNDRVDRTMDELATVVANIKLESEITRGSVRLLDVRITGVETTYNQRITQQTETFNHRLSQLSEQIRSNRSEIDKLRDIVYGRSSPGGPR